MYMPVFVSIGWGSSLDPMYIYILFYIRRTNLFIHSFLQHPVYPSQLLCGAGGFDSKKQVNSIVV